MGLFAYTAVDTDGALVKGVTEAADREQAMENIAYNGLYVVSIKSAVSPLASLRRHLLYRKIKRRDIIEFVNNIALMLRAGVPLLTALADVAETTEERRFREALINMRRLVEMGTSFSSALKEYRTLFPDMLIRLVAVGEETGSLDKSLRDVAIHLQRIEDLIASVTRALIYPAFALLATLGALGFWMFFVVPQLMATFSSMGLELPLTTKLLMHLSVLTQRYWYAILVVPIIVWLCYLFMKRMRGARYILDACSLKIPIIHLLVHNKLLALFAEQLRILIAAGITIDRSLEITADVIGNEVFRSALLQSREYVVAGNRISDALKRHSIFPNIVKRMIEIGETSGSLETQLEYLSEYFLKRVDDIAEKLSKMIEPLIILVVGIVFLLIIMSLLFPVYDLVTKIGE
ncbi:MAG: type II secretion system F family protein [Desulfobacterota bacterium]|nr:type II secretion system F family protein [Thermodesulfobacteriota bacterium]